MDTTDIHRQTVLELLYRRNWRLAFPAWLERRYAQGVFLAAPGRNLAYLGLGLGVYLVFALVDWLSIPQAAIAQAWLARGLATGCALLCLIPYFATRKANRAAFFLSLILVCIFAGATGVVVVGIREGNMGIAMGPVLILMYLSAYPILPFRWTALLLLCLPVVYAITVLKLTAYQFPGIVFHMLFFPFVMLFGLAASYQMEKSRRREFLQKWLIIRQNAELLRTQRALVALSESDPLTGIANRRRFEEVIRLEWNRCLRMGLPISILMVDVDHFKDFNDAAGHQEGDRALIGIAQALKECLHRPSDVCARYGGEEFILAIIGEPGFKVERHAQTIRGRIEALGIAHPAGGAVTISIGVHTGIPSSTDSLDRMIDCADRALYRAKREGRNRVCVSAESGGTDDFGL